VAGDLDSVGCGIALADESEHRATVGELDGPNRQRRGHSAHQDTARHLQLVNERIRVVRMQEFLDTERIEKTIRQHLSIVNALLADDTAGAVLLLVSHLDEARHQATIRATAAVERMMTAGAVFTSAR
jgi:FCD domain